MSTITNYNEKITNAENLETLEAVLENLNNDIQDNVEIIFDMAKLDKAVKTINEEYKNNFSKLFAFNLDKDRKTTFENLVKNPNFDKVVITDENGTISIEVKKTLFRFSDLENYYQLLHSTETDKKGKPIKNKSVSVFGALRFYGLCDCFIRNLFTNNLVIDNDKVYDLSRVKIADKTIFDENDGKCFASTSNNALEKQLNILTRFFGLDVKMLKKDLPILKLSAQKIKRDVESNKASINEIKTLKFADILFSVVTSRYNNENVKVYTNDGKEVAEIKTETETETTTENQA